ncbi:glycosyltransferase family 1 protein [bacterium]|nr:MAG: glycosyltransferase family 1 protein [bacterium]
MLEYLDRIPVYSLIQQASQLGHYKAFITFWKEFVPNWSLLVDRGKIFHVPAMVDLERFSPNGPKFSFGSKGGNPNILIFDNWREDTTPYNVIHAAIRFIKNRVSAGKIHLFGLHSDKKILDKYMGFLAEQGFIGHAWSFVDFVQEILRSADMLVTPHVIATRVIRESLACGCPVVAGGGCPYTPYRADPRNEADFARAMEKCWFDVLCKKDDLREQSRKTAEEQFSLKAAGEKMIQICEFAMQEKRTGIRLHA